MKIVFMGTPEFAVPSLETLVAAGHEVGLCLTQPDRVQGRGHKLLFSPVKEKALELGIRVLQPTRVRGDEELYAELAAYAPDVICVAAYGQILPENVLKLPRYGALNVHASLLPRHRGAAPIQRAILEGDEKTGVTIMQMAAGLDTGDMMARVALTIGDLDYPTLSAQLASHGAWLLRETLTALEKGTATWEKQDDEKATYAGMITKADGRIDFPAQDAAAIIRMMRAFRPWPGIYCELDGEVMKILDAEALAADETTEGQTPGTVLAAGREGIDIATRTRILRVKALQMPGKKAMDADSFLRGRKIPAGTVLK
ncbi:MAG: methionyl-tRNA formyltransferase [Firmicutes bacterium]|nr:methionyl-tRNA formyltransferase [Bacillota bacterium]